jgi:hypothetical protein
MKIFSGLSRLPTAVEACHVCADFRLVSGFDIVFRPRALHNPKTGVVTPSTFVVEGDWLESAAILSRNGTFSNG